MHPVKSKLFKKLLLFGILTATLPVLLFGAFSWAGTSMFVRDRLAQANLLMLERVRSDIDAELSSIDAQITQFAVSPATVEAMNISRTRFNWDTFSGVNLIQARRRELQTILQAGARRNLSLTVVSFVGEWLVNNDGFYLTDRASVQPTIEVVERILRAGEGQEGLILLNDADTLYLARRITHFGREAYGLIVAALPKAGWDPGLEPSGPDDAAFVTDADGALILTAGGLPEDFRQALLSAAPDKGCVVTSVTSPYNGWRYHYYMSMKNVQYEIGFYRNILLAVCAGLLAAIILASVTVSQRIYSPIAAVARSIAPASRQADELATITRYLNDVGEANRHLESVLDQQKSYVEEHFYFNLMRGRVSHTQIAAYEGVLGIRPRPSFRVGVLAAESLGVSDFTSYDGHLVLIAVSNIAHELIPPEPLQYGLIVDESLVLLFAGSEEDTAADRVAGFLESVSAAVLKHLRVHLGGGVSAAFHELAGASMACSQAVSARRRRGADRAIGFWEGQPAADGDSIYPEQTKNLMLAAMQKGDMERARRELAESLSVIVDQPSGYYGFQVSLLRLYLELIEQFQSLGARRERLYAEGLEHLARLGKSRNVISFFCDEIFDPLARLYAEQRGGRLATLSESVIAIVQDRFDTPLTLEQCAAEVGYHPVYVSRMFRQQTGQSFKEYLYLFRVEKAKQMLTRTDMQVQEISQKLCYNNPQNFIRLFGKVVGMTPGDYRRRFQNV